MFLDGNRDIDVVSEFCEHLCLLKKLIDEFRTVGHSKSPMFAFWESFLFEVMQPIKLFLHSTRVGDWPVYRNAMVCLLPILAAANRTNYTRYLPIILMMQNRLPPDVEDAFIKEQFVVKISAGSHNAQWSDYTP